MWKYVFLFGLIGGLNLNYKLLKERRFQFYFVGWAMKTLIAVLIGTINIIIREVPLDGYWLWTSGYFIFWLILTWFIGLALDLLLAAIDQDFEETMLRYVTGFSWVCWAVFVVMALVVMVPMVSEGGKIICQDFNAVQSDKGIVLNDPNGYPFKACEIFPPREENIFRLSSKEACKRADKVLADANLPSYEVTNMYLQLRGDKLCFVGPARMRKDTENKCTEKGLGIGDLAGYVVVDASCRGKAEYAKHAISVYKPDDAYTCIYTSGGIYYTMHDAEFQIDPNGNPVWVSFLKRDNEEYPWIDIAEGIMVLDATNKKVKHYSRDEIPEWMKIVLPPDVCTEWLKLFASNNNYTLYNELGTFTNGKDVFLAYEIATGNRFDSLAAVNRRTGDIMVTRGVINADSDGAVKMLNILWCQKVTKSDAKTICPVVIEDIGVSEHDPNNTVAWQRLVWAMNMGNDEIALVSSNASKCGSYYIGKYTDTVFRDLITRQLPERRQQ